MASNLTYYIYRDRAGHWRWTLRSANNRTIADSGEGYVNRSDCLSAISLVSTSGNALVKDL